jgi:hypothetical protein
MNKYNTVNTIVTTGLEQTVGKMFCMIILPHCSHTRALLKAPLLFWLATECCSPMWGGSGVYVKPVLILQFIRQI